MPRTRRSWSKNGPGCASSTCERGVVQGWLLIELGGQAAEANAEEVVLAGVWGGGGARGVEAGGFEGVWEGLGGGGGVWGGLGRVWGVWEGLGVWWPEKGLRYSS